MFVIQCMTAFLYLYLYLLYKILKPVKFFETESWVIDLNDLHDEERISPTERLKSHSSLAKG